MPNCSKACGPQGVVPVFDPDFLPHRNLLGQQWQRQACANWPLRTSLRPSPILNPVIGDVARTPGCRTAIGHWVSESLDHLTREDIGQHPPIRQIARTKDLVDIRPTKTSSQVQLGAVGETTVLQVELRKHSLRLATMLLLVVPSPLPMWTRNPTCSSLPPSAQVKVQVIEMPFQIMRATPKSLHVGHHVFAINPT